MDVDVLTDSRAMKLLKSLNFIVIYGVLEIVKYLFDILWRTINVIKTFKLDMK